MNPKVANIIAVELGILILIAGWFAFAHFPKSAPPAAPVAGESAVDSSAPLTRYAAPMSEQFSEVPDPAAANVPIDAEVEPPAPVVQVVEPSYVSEDYLTTQPESGYGAEEEPSYSEVISQPGSSDDLVAAPPSIYAYRPSTQIVVFSNVYAFDPRCRRTPRMDDTQRTIAPRSVPPARMPTMPQGNVVVAPRTGNSMGDGRRGNGTDVAMRPKANPRGRPGLPVQFKRQP